MSYAYPEKLLHNMRLHNEARKLQKADFIDELRLQEIVSGLPALNTRHNFFARLGLFLFTFILILALLGLLALMSESSEDGFKMIILLVSVASFLSLEYFIHSKRYFNFGVDNALLFAGQFLLLIFIAFESRFNDVLIISVVAVIAGMICSYRYVDGFSAVVACSGFTCLIGNSCMKAGDIGQSLLPFALMAVAGIIFFIYRLLINTERVARVWSSCLKVVYAFSLILFYAAGNYMIVRMGHEELLGVPVTNENDIPLAWLFYMFTILIPIAYIYFGLQKKNRMLLQVGILALAFGAYSIRYYHLILPIEWGLILAGSILFSIAYYSMRLLKNKTAGIIFNADRFANTDNELNAEALIIAEGLKLQPIKEQTGPTFGGGEFGGGGAEGNF